MPVDYRAELKRPLPLTLLVLALLGWIVAIGVWVTYSRNSTALRREVRQLAIREGTTRSELDALRRAGGSLSDLQAKLAAAQQQVTQLEQDRSQSEGRVAAVQQASAQAAQAADDQAKRLAEAQGQLQQLQQQMGALRGEVTTTEQNIARRAQELAEVGRRVEAARQQEAKAREDLTKLDEELKSKSAELSQAEQRLQQARELEARLQATRQEIIDAEAKLGEARRQLAIPPPPAQERSAQPQLPQSPPVQQ